MILKDDALFYLAVIEGNFENTSDMFLDLPEELRESAILNHAFDRLDEIGGPLVVAHLTPYIDENYNIYSYKKSGAIDVLGANGEQKHGDLIYPYLESNNVYLVFTSVCSMLELLDRKKLSDQISKKFVFWCAKTLSEFECSCEIAVECAVVLDKVGYADLDKLLNKASESSRNFAADYQASLRWRKSASHRKSNRMKSIGKYVSIARAFVDKLR